MIGQLKILHQVKSLKEEQALRTLQAKRRQAEEGQAVLERARATEAQSRATLGLREDAIYDRVLGRVVSPEALDDTRGAVIVLEKDHARLTDAVERAVHVQARLAAELETSATHHRAAAKVRDKYTLLLGDARETARIAVDAAEDGEIEELFGTRRRALA